MRPTAFAKAESGVSGIQLIGLKTESLRATMVR